MRTQEDGTFPERHVSDLNIFVAKAMGAVELHASRPTGETSSSFTCKIYAASPIFILLDASRRPRLSSHVRCTDPRNNWRRPLSFSRGALQVLRTRGLCYRVQASTYADATIWFCCRLANLVAFLAGGCLASGRNEPMGAFQSSPVCKRIHLWYWENHFNLQ